MHCAGSPTVLICVVVGILLFKEGFGGNFTEKEDTSVVG